jgi:hypothetical protein
MNSGLFNITELSTPTHAPLIVCSKDEHREHFRRKWMKKAWQIWHWINNNYCLYITTRSIPEPISSAPVGSISLSKVVAVLKLSSLASSSRLLILFARLNLSARISSILELLSVGFWLFRTFRLPDFSLFSVPDFGFGLIEFKSKIKEV